MPNNKLAKKRIFITAKKMERNRYYRTKIKNIIRAVHEAVEASDKTATTLAFAAANKNIHSLVSKGFIKKTTAARKISRLHNMVNIAELDNKENQISLKAKDIFSQASIETLNSGDSILKVIENSIYTIYPNGEKTKIKDIKTPIQVTKDSKISLKEII